MSLTRKDHIFKGLAAGLASAALSLTATTGTAIAAPPGDIPFGVYDPEGVFSTDAEVSIEHLFMPWQDVALDSLLDADEYAIERNRVSLVTIEPWTWSRDERNKPEVLRKGIQDGYYDQNMAAICSVLSTFGSPVTVRWAHEMDDVSGQFIWANWEPEIYIDPYKRMVDVCRDNAPSVRYMWSPIGSERLSEYYPGDEYVDLVGISVFGLEAWERQFLGEAQSFLDIATPKYERVSKFGKPVVIAELGYVGSADYVEDWDQAVRQVYPQFPLLVSVIYFNQKEVYPWPDGFGLPNWKVEEQVLN